MTPSPPLRRLRVGLIALAVISAVGLSGYWFASGSLLDAVYMIVVTLSTVGYRETVPISPALQVFTIVFIVFGVSTAIYLGGVFVQMILEGEVNRAIGQRRVTHEIKHLADHVIICGFGRTGEILAGELRRRNRRFVVLDESPDRVAEATAQGHLGLINDAREEQALEDAGVRRAKTVVAALPGDADNVFITLTARNLNPQLQIIARGELASTEKKLIQAGADRVVLPATAGALRMAAMITRPSMVELIELAAGRQMTEVEIDEWTVPPESPLANRTVRQAELRARHGLLIVALRKADGVLSFNPDADVVLGANDAIIIMGRPGDIERFRREYGI